MIELAEATRADIPRLEAIYQTIGQKSDGYFDACFDQGRVIIMAVCDGADCGFGMLNFAPRYSLYKRLDYPEIQDLNVVPDFRNRGIATMMIAYCEDMARARGHEGMGISVGLYKEYGPAQRLYAKLGYMPDGFGITCDREPVNAGQTYRLDDDLCLMLVKEFQGVGTDSL